MLGLSLQVLRRVGLWPGDCWENGLAATAGRLGVGGDPPTVNGAGVGMSTLPIPPCPPTCAPSVGWGCLPYRSFVGAGFSDRRGRLLDEELVHPVSAVPGPLSREQDRLRLVRGVGWPG